MGDKVYLDLTKEKTEETVDLTDSSPQKTYNAQPVQYIDLTASPAKTVQKEKHKTPSHETKKTPLEDQKPESSGSGARRKLHTPEATKHATDASLELRFNELGRTAFPTRKKGGATKDWHKFSGQTNSEVLADRQEGRGWMGWFLTTMVDGQAVDEEVMKDKQAFKSMAHTPNKPWKDLRDFVQLARTLGRL